HGRPVEDDECWEALDELLRSEWSHPLGGKIRISAMAIDAGFGTHQPRVQKFCQPRLGRKVFAIKGVEGFSRQAFARAKFKRGPALFLVGVDPLKLDLYNKLERGRGIKFSNTLSADYFEQLTSERRVTKLSRGKPVVRFERKLGAKAEALDCFVYASACRAA